MLETRLGRLGNKQSKLYSTHKTVKGTSKMYTCVLVTVN